MNHFIETFKSNLLLLLIGACSIQLAISSNTNLNQLNDNEDYLIYSGSYARWSESELYNRNINDAGEYSVVQLRDWRRDNYNSHETIVSQEDLLFKIEAVSQHQLSLLPHEPPSSYHYPPTYNRDRYAPIVHNLTWYCIHHVASNAIIRVNYDLSCSPFITMDFVNQTVGLDTLFTFIPYGPLRRYEGFGNFPTYFIINAKNTDQFINPDSGGHLLMSDFKTWIPAQSEEACIWNIIPMEIETEWKLNGMEIETDLPQMEDDERTQIIENLMEERHELIQNISYRTSLMLRQKKIMNLYET